LWKVSFGGPPEEEAGDGSGPAAWARLGDYDLYDEIAHGGMGVVYRATQRRLGRQVAVKVLRGGALADPEARRRFRREAESAGRLQHPGVVAVHDVGEDQGVCWFSMDYVPGENLAQRVQQRAMEARAAAACVRKVAEAIQHAHENGVLHRDLKPSNILMGLDDQPKVTDFGLARHLEETTGWRVAALTHSGQTLGSPGYAAPEQALFGKAAVAADVYGLGAVLYHTLTGRAPFVGPTLDSILLQLRETEPVPPRRLNPTVPPDLETICLKCLEKAPERRYVSAAALAEDLRRFLMGEVLLARPVGLPGKAVRWCRQRPALAGLAAAFFLAAALGTGGVIYQWRRAERKAAAEVWQRELAQKGERAARLRTYTAGVFAASQALLEEDTGRAGDLLEGLIPVPGTEDFCGPEWYLLQNRTRSQDLRVLTGHPWIVACLAASPDGRWLASGGRYVSGWGGEQSTCFVWNPATGEQVFKGKLGMGSVRSLAFTRDGQRLMVSAAGRTGFLQTGTWTEVAPSVSGNYGCLAHGQPWLATTAPNEGEVPGFQGTLVLYHADDLKEIRRYPVWGTQVAFTPDDRFLVVMGLTEDLQVCPVEGDGPVRRYVSGRRMNAMAVSPDGHWLAACGGSDVQVWDLTAAEGTAPRLLSGHGLDVKGITFAPSGDRLITTGSDRTIRFWDTAEWKAAGVLRGHRDEVWCAQQDPQGHWLATGSKDRTVRLWPVRPLVAAPGPSHKVTQPMVWSRDGKKIMTCLRSGGSRVCDPGQGTGGAEIPITARAADADGTWCRFVEGPGRIEWFDDAGKLVRSVPLEGDPVRFKDIESMAWALESHRFALALPGQKVAVWDTTSGRRVAFLDRPAGGLSLPVTLSRDGRQLAVAGSSAAVALLYVVETGAVQKLIGHFAQITTLAFSPDGRQLASGSVDATIRLWDTATGAAQAVLRGHVQDVNAVAYAPGGHTLASVGNFEAVRFWNLETATEVATLPMNDVTSFLSFSPDGRWLAVNRGSPAGRPSPEMERLLLLPTGHDTAR